MKKKKAQSTIVKVQISIYPAGMVLIYDKDRSFMQEFPLVDEVMQMASQAFEMGVAETKMKFFAHATLTPSVKNGEEGFDLNVNSIAEWQEW